MKRYDEYIEINSPWIKNIPMNWNAKRLKSVAAYISRGETPVYTDDTSCTKVINQATFSQGYWNTKKVRYTSSSPIGNKSVPKQRDILLASTGRGVLGKVFYFDQSDTYIADGHVTIIRTCKTLNSRFLYYYLSVHFDTINGLLARGSTNQTELQEYPLKNMPVPLPSADEQDQIVRYLDWQVSKINRLIAAKRKRIALISASKHAFASKLVTKGLDASCTMRYSGVNWLGDIPKHWQISKLRTILHPVSEKNRPDLPLLSVVREKGVIPRDVDDKESNHNYIPDDLSGYKVVRTHQFVINKMKAWQGSYGIAPCDGIVSPAYFVFNIDFDNLEYFHHAIRSKVYVNFFAQASDGIRVGQWDLSIDKMKDIPFILPPSDEQAAIVESIKKNNAQADTTISALEKQIAVLQELRTRLISDVVTGRVDVRGIEVPDFEYVGEADVAGEQDEESEVG